MNTVLLTAYTKPFDRYLAAAFARQGYRVFAMGADGAQGIVGLPEDIGQAKEALGGQALDIYVDLSDQHSLADDFTARDGLDGKVIRALYEANVLRPMALLEAFLPLLDAGEGKRLCFLSSAEASINEARGIDGYGYKMSKAALHQFLQMVHNELFPKGYTLRAYDPCHREVSPEGAAEAAFRYITRRRGVENGDPKRDDEDRLMLRDAMGRQHAW